MPNTLKSWKESQVRAATRRAADKARARRRIDGGSARNDLPLDIQVTAFQRRVYEELLRIPTGETRTYAEIAEAIGQPTAARAVGNACASNPVALAIPCHRVLRNNGTLGGYAWGTERKQALISAERRAARRAG